MIEPADDFRAVDPFFRIIEQGLAELVGGEHFFDLLADDVEVVATGYPYGNRYISVITIEDRKVSQWRDYLDPLRVFAALEGCPFFEPDAPSAS